MAARNGSAEWKGDLQSGTGTLSLGSGSFSGPYSFTSRFEDGSGTNPEELIAAAHAACFAMAMSAILAQEGHPVDSVRTTANVTLRRVDDAPTITKIELTAEGKVPGIDEAGVVQCTSWAGDGSHRIPMMQRANQTPAVDSVRITVK